MHTKLSSPNNQPNMIIADNIPMDKNMTNTKSASLKTLTKNPVHSTAFNNFNTIIFVREIVLILYDDDKENMYEKNSIASVFLDNVIACYTEEVCKNLCQVENSQRCY